MVQGPSFDTEAKRHQGRGFAWIERMLTASSTSVTSHAQWGPSKDAVARSALKNLLASNHDVIDVSLDQCYSPHAAVSRAYFQVDTARPTQGNALDASEAFSAYHLV